LRKQVEERLDFYATGAAPTKNEDAMVRLGILIPLYFFFY